MKINTTSNTLSLLFVILIVCLTLTLLQGYFFVFRRQWIFMGAITVVGLINSTSYLRQKQTIWLLIYFLIVSFNALSGDDFWSARGQSVAELFLLTAPSIMTFYALKNDDRKFMKTVLTVFFVIVVLETIASFIANLKFPDIIRILTSMRNNSSSESAWYYYRMGIANYDIGHALPALLPLLIWEVRYNATSKSTRRICLVLLVFTLVLIYISAITTALLLSVFAVLLALFTQKGTLKRNLFPIMVLSLIFIPFILSDSLILDLLSFVNGYIPSEYSLHDKIIDIQETILYGETSGDLSLREEKYTSTISLFQENMLLGTNSKVGGHSSFLDRLSSLGIVGFIPYVVFLYLQIKKLSDRIHPEYRIVYFEGILMCLLMLLMKDADSWEMFFTMFTLVPFMTYLLSIQSNKIS